MLIRARDEKKFAEAYAILKTGTAIPKEFPDYDYNMRKLCWRTLNALPRSAQQYWDLAYKHDTNPPMCGNEDRWAHEEDKRRAKGLKSAAMALRAREFEFQFGRQVSVPAHLMPAVIGLNAVARNEALDLAARLERNAGERQFNITMSLASATFMQQFRIKLLGAIVEIIDSDPAIPVEAFCIQHANWCFPVHELQRGMQVAARRQLRSDFRKVGNSSSTGFVMAYTDVQFNLVSHSFQLYFSGIIAGGKVNKLKELVALTDGRAAISRRQILSEAGPYSLDKIAGAIVKWWPEQTWGKLGYRLSPENASEPTDLGPQYQSHYLRWLDDHYPLEILFFDGIELCDGEMRLTGHKTPVA